ncbi:MAG: CHAT domain-containing protein [Prochlorococcus marinus CUG1438]|nr:CHAT domain-containing protein [Prochlorococcus marinus CUG1438]
MFFFALKNKKQISIIFFIFLNILSPYEYLKSQEIFRSDIQDNKIYKKAIRSDELVKKGLESLEKKDYENAIFFFDKASKIDQTNSNAYFYKAFVKDILGDFKGAIDDYSKAININPSWQSFLNRGLAKTEIRDFKESIIDFSKSLKLNPNYYKGFLFRGIAKQKLGDFKESIDDFTKYLNLNGDDTNILFLRGLSKYSLKDFIGSIEDYSKALKINPKYKEALLNRGISKSELGEYEASIDDFSNLIKLDPNQIDAYFLRGLSRNMVQEYKEAIKDFDVVIKNDPNNDDALNARGLSKGALNKFQNAIDDFDKAILINPKNKLAIENKIFYEERQITEKKFLISNTIIKLSEEIKKLEEKKDYKNIIKNYKKIIELEKKDNRVSSFPYSAIAFNFEKIGNYDKAIEYQIKGIKVEEKLTSKDSLEVANLLDGLSFLYYRGQYFVDKLYFKEVVSIKERVLKIKENVFGLENIQTAASYQNLAGLYSEIGNYEKAISLRKKAIQIANISKEQNDFYTSIPDYKAFLYSQIHHDYNQIGDYRNAKKNAIIAFEIRTKIFDKNDLSLAKSYSDLAGVYFYLGDFKESKKMLNNALKIYKIKKRKYKFEVNYLEKLKSILLVLEGGKGKLSNNFLLSKNADENDPEIVTKLIIDGATLALSKSYDQSLDVYKKALFIIKSKRGINNYQSFTTLKSIGEVYLYKGDLKKSEEYLKESLKIHSLYLNKSRLSLDIIQLYQSLARLYIEKKDSIDAEKYIEKTIDSGILLAKEQSQYLPEKDREKFSAIVLNSYEILFSLIDKLPNGKKLALKARLNRQGLLEDIEKYQSNLSDLNNKQKMLLEEIKNINTQISDVSVDKNIFDKLNNQKEKLEEKLYSEIPALEPKIIEIEQIKKNIPANSVLIEFQKFRPVLNYDFYSDNFGEYSYLALVLKPNGEIFKIDLGLAKPLEEKINNAILSTENQKPNAISLWKEIGELIIKPIENRIGSVNTLFISPDSELNRIPFAAIGSSDQKLLFENKNIRLLTTGRELIKIKNIKSKNLERSLVVANPKFDLTNKVVSEISKKINFGQQRSGVLSNQKWNELLGTEKEGRVISKFLNADLLLQENATSLEIEKVNSPKILHIASHSYFIPNEEEKNPLLRSGIVLAGANNPNLNSSDDGYLTALEITRLNWEGTELVVISGCESGKGESQSGEGVFGLKRSISVAGASSSLLSLWKVDDAGTARFMESFYKKLIEGQSKAEALKNTQKDFLNHPIPGLRHPYYWAAFQLSGDWKSLNK